MTWADPMAGYSARAMEVSSERNVVGRRNFADRREGLDPAHLDGVLLLVVIQNLVSFESGHTGWHFTLASYWQTIVRGLCLLEVSLLHARLSRSEPPSVQLS